MTQENQPVSGEPVPATPMTELEVMIKESNLPQTKAQILLTRFNHYFGLAAQREKQLETLKVTDVTQVAEMKLADELRKASKRDRTAIEKVRRELNDENQAEIKIVNAIAKVLTALIEPLETKAEQIAKFAEIKAKEEKERLQGERMAALAEYGYTGTQDLAAMTEVEFEAFKEGLRVVKERKDEEAKAREKKALEDAQLTTERNQELTKYPFRLNMHPYGYDELHKYSQEEWATVIRTADAYLEKERLYDERKAKLIAAGWKYANDTFSFPGQPNLSKADVVDAGQLVFADYIVSAEQNQKLQELKNQRYQYLKGKGFIADPVAKTVVYKEHNIVITAEQLASSEQEWEQCLARVNRILELHEWRKSLMIYSVPDLNVVVTVGPDDSISTMTLQVIFRPIDKRKYSQDSVMTFINIKEHLDRTLTELKYQQECGRRINDLCQSLPGIEFDATEYWMKRPKFFLSQEQLFDMDIHELNKLIRAHQTKITEQNFSDRSRTESMELYGFTLINNEFVNKESGEIYPINILDYDGNKWFDLMKSLSSEKDQPQIPVEKTETKPIMYVTDTGGAGGAVWSDGKILDDFAKQVSSIKPRYPLQTGRGTQAWNNIDELIRKVVTYTQNCAEALRN